MTLQLVPSGFRLTTQDGWADHCSNWPAYSRETCYSETLSTLSTYTSGRPPRFGQKASDPHILVGIIVYENNVKTYYVKDPE